MEQFYAPVDEMPLFIAILNMLRYEAMDWRLKPRLQSASLLVATSAATTTTTSPTDRQSGLELILNAIIKKPVRSAVEEASVLLPDEASSDLLVHSERRGGEGRKKEREGGGKGDKGRGKKGEGKEGKGKGDRIDKGKGGKKKVKDKK